MMHRFRVRSKSDASKRLLSDREAPPPASMSLASPTPKLDPLPPASDFRTSLIMPSLSRRFTLLRGQNGEPLSIDDVRSRLAQQRANGHVNHVTEEEEEIMIDALIRAHSIDPTASPSDSDGYTTATANDGYSTAYTNTNDSYASGYDSPRYGDSSYVRTAASSIASLNSAPKRKVTLSTPSIPGRDIGSQRNDLSASNSSIKETTESVGAGSIAFDTYLSNSTFSPAQIRRASLALQEAIQEYEEDEEDEKILAPRSGPLKSESQEHDSHGAHGESPVGYGEAIAWPNDQSQSGPHDTSGSATAPYNTPSSPNYNRMDAVNRLPGYVPGMHRPITPRDSTTDTDTNTGTSTPQPASSVSTPGYDYSPSSVSSPGRSERALPQSILLNKRASTTNSSLRTRPRELSDSGQHDAGGSSSDSTQTPLKSALSDRRRPTSPLVDAAYQSAIRTGTPSNNFMEAWSPSAVSFATSSPPRVVSSSSVRESHLRQASNASSGLDTDSYYSNQPRSPASPTSPDSPTINGSSGLANIVSSWNGASTNVIVDEPVHRTSTPRISVLENGHATASQRGVRPYSPHSRSGTPNMQSRRGAHSRSGSLATDVVSGRRSPRSSHAHSSSSGPRQNPLMMSPLLNSSRSSLASTGSSYHSWDEDQLGGKKPHKRGVSVFIDSDSAPWKKRRSGFDIDLGMENAPAPDEIREVLAGLTVQDILAVQEKLVAAAVKKRVSVPGVRPLSGQRRRRASAGQSMTSMASPTEPGVASPPRIASPPPVVQTPPPNPNLNAIVQPPSTPPMTKSAEDQAKKANALLHAMMDSIESSPHKPPASPPAAPVAQPPSPQPQSLAPQASFSSEEPQSATPPSPADEPATPDTPVPEQDPRQKALADALFGSDSDATVKDSQFGFGRSQSLRAFTMPPATSDSPAQEQEKEQQFPVQENIKSDERLLAEDVERRAMAATAALKSASTPRLHEGNGMATNGRKAGKKLNTRQISSPQLVSATTSVDTIPLSALAGSQPSTPISQLPPPPTQQHSQSKLSQRFKKLTGNLRTRAPLPTGEEISPYVIEVSTPPAEQTPANGTTRVFPSADSPKSAPIITADSPAPAPTTPNLDDSQSSSAPSTPTQPRLRGFMARLRKGRKDSTDTRARAPSPLGPNGQMAKTIPPPPHIPAAMLKIEPVRMPDNLSSSSLAPSGAGVEAPPPPPPPVASVGDSGIQQTAPTTSHVPSHTPAPSQQVDEEAIRQLYDAASQLGLDKSAIKDILVRSQSTSSRSTAWTQMSSAATPSTADTPLTPPLPPPATLDRSMSMTTPKPPRAGASLGRQLSLKPYTGTLPLRSASTTPDDNAAPRASVIRRTVIFPSPPGRTSSEMARRPSTSKHRRTRSGSIHSNKSVQDRAPTPPPSRAPVNKRFSKDLFPPVPQLPSGVEGTATSTPQVQRSGSASGNASNYDSLYEMYAEPGQPDLSGQEGGQNEQIPVGSAVEVLELSDGQIVWSVVDGLRAAGEDYEGDEASFPRLSRTSEYSAPDTHELRFRDHQRSASKSSATSAASKSAKQSTRPETRIYFSSAGDIGTLIDTLTKNTEAGQFNILPGLPGIPTSSGSLRPLSGAQSAHSFNGSYNSTLPDGDWTIEERIDQMLAASRRRPGP